MYCEPHVFEPLNSLMRCLLSSTIGSCGGHGERYFPRGGRENNPATGAVELVNSRRLDRPGAHNKLAAGWRGGSQGRIRGDHYVHCFYFLQKGSNPHAHVCQRRYKRSRATVRPDRAAIRRICRIRSDVRARVSTLITDVSKLKRRAQGRQVDPQGSRIPLRHQENACRLRGDRLNESSAVLADESTILKDALSARCRGTKRAVKADRASRRGSHPVCGHECRPHAAH